MQEQVYDYDWLFKKIYNYVFEDESLPYNFFSALSTRKDMCLDFSEWEWSFLHSNLDFVKRTVNRILPASMIYLVTEASFGSFHTRDLSRMTGQSEQKVNKWANKLASKGLLVKRPLSFDNRVYYVAAARMPMVNRILIDLVLIKYSKLEIEKFLQRSQEKRMLNQKRMEQIRRYRRLYYKKHRK